MEKIAVGLELSRKWTDPPIILMGISLVFLPSLIIASLLLAFKVHIALVVLPTALVWAWYTFVYMNTGPADTEKFIVFKDAKLKARFAKKRIPVCFLYESYISGDLDFKGDVLDALNHRDEFVSYQLSFSLVVFLLRQLFPQTSSSFHHKSADQKEISLHYDRGNDFFAGFLGPSMVYTSAVYHGLQQTLEQAQENKLSLICNKLQVKPGDNYLDIGCGWGTLVRHAAGRFGAKATGVTLSKEGAEWCRAKNKEEKLEGKAEILNIDYRDIPEGKKFKRVSAIEMAEHVGLRNFQAFLAKIKDLMEDDGLYLMQVAGLRKGSDWEDIQWGLFMSKYIFPGADASTPLNWYVKQLEQAGFEVRSVETIGKHYSHTIHQWYRNWEQNKANLEPKYGGPLIRLWAFFLAWSVIAPGQGTAACYQILCHKNTSKFDRDIFTSQNTHVGMYTAESKFA
eukprot:TRINITY_DN80324_c0_g1_i1.p1 TRINITY_DN80324_c0_g1~~TRINITY_DN80324_c0_g1_i1.p1  ORF type:complete len:470 (+),score=130.33 TRINITY_DN80324_c0_g1_i1:52-1410(+)